MRTLLVLLVLTACGRTTSPYGVEPPKKFSLTTKGYYRAAFKAVNSRFKSASKGRASFFINNTQFYAKVNLTTPWKDVAHFQAMHEGSVCPTMQDDLNLDGFVDGAEVLSAVGGVLIPLDANLENQKSKVNVTPVSNDKGAYMYSQAGSSSVLMLDLRSRDRDPLDFMAKLKAYEEIRFTERVVVIYGVPDNFDLPDSVEGLGEFSPHFSIPIACGEILETDEVFP